jgi:hypothetical protein
MRKPLLIVVAGALGLTSFAISPSPANSGGC